LERRIVRYAVFKRRGEKEFPALRVPRQRTFVLVDVLLREGKAVGSEKGED
jgi:hypothetical protein